MVKRLPFCRALCGGTFIINGNITEGNTVRGPGSVVGVDTGYRLDGPGIESRWGAIFSAPVQTGPGAHPASCTMDTGSFPEVKNGRGVTLTPHPLLVPWSRKSRAIPLLPLRAVWPVESLSACTRVHFTHNTVQRSSNGPLFTCLSTDILLLIGPYRCTLFNISAANVSGASSVCKLQRSTLSVFRTYFNPLKPELNPICYLLALLGAHHFLHVSRIRVKLLIFRRLMSYIYIYGTPILDVSRSHTTTQHSR